MQIVRKFTIQHYMRVKGDKEMTILKIISFILLALSLIGVMYYLRSRDILKRAADQAKDALETAAVNGAREAKRKVLRQDEQINGFAKWLDLARRLYVYSRIGSRTALSFEIWMVLMTVSAAVVYFLVSLLTGLKGGLIAAAADIAAFYVLQKVLAHSNYKKVDAELIKFVDLLSNFSATSGEITDILHQISRYMSAPLSNVLEECYYDARTCGNTTLALYALADKIEHPMFKNLIRNIEICINYTADFAVIVVNSRKLLANEQRAKKQRRSMASENLIDMFIVSVGMLACLIIVDMLGTGIWQLVTDTSIGHICIMIVAVIYVVFGASIASAER